MQHATFPHLISCLFAVVSLLGAKTHHLLTVRWNSHLVLSNSGGSPSVLPLVDLPPASGGVGIRDLGALKLFYLKFLKMLCVPP